MIFYLGTNEPSWLSRTDVPLFISRRRLARLKSWPRALGPWMLDSGGFSELSECGRWETTAEIYLAETRRWSDAIGNLVGAAPQDWMCEPGILAETGLTVTDHQERTVASFLWLREREPSLPWFPVLQGWEPEDYLRHIDLYQRAGVDLSRETRVGVGTVCRRQDTRAIEAVVSGLMGRSLTLHGFGVKRSGLALCSGWFASADSMAWSRQARSRQERLPGCTHTDCRNCFDYALRWRARLVGSLGGFRPCQLALGGLA